MNHVFVGGPQISPQAFGGENGDHAMEVLIDMDLGCSFAEVGSPPRLYDVGTGKREAGRGPAEGATKATRGVVRCPASESRDPHRA